jgi:mRNA interferase HigB
VHVITRKRLREFSARHKDAVKPLDAWFQVFNIGGHKYRLVVNVRYDLGRVYIRHVLTHEEYDEIMAKGAL